MEGEIKTKISAIRTKVIYTFYIRIYKFPPNQHSSKREGPLGTMEVREEVGRSVHRGPCLQHRCVVVASLLLCCDVLGYTKEM